MRQFSYEKPSDPAAAAARAAEVDGARFLAGGTNLLDLMKLEIETPVHVIDVNGLTSGNQNAAARSVLPGEATAHLSFRLVPDQDPDVIRARFRAHVRAFVPKDCAVIHVGDDAGRPYAIDESDPFIRITMAAVRDEWGVTPVLKGNGGTNPVMRWMKDRLGLDSVMLGFGLSDDAIHAPNEKLDLRCFHKGMRSWVHVLCAIAREGRAPAGG